jgi:hypothetical protein
MIPEILESKFNIPNALPSARFARSDRWNSTMLPISGRYRTARIPKAKSISEIS